LATVQNLGGDSSKSNPLVLESRLGKGAVLLFASSADRDWSDWPQCRLYVPLVHQMIGYLTERLPENQRIHVEVASHEPPGVSRSGTKVIVRNLDPRESEIERFTVREFREIYHISAKDTESEDQQPESLASGSQRPDEVWAYVVWALLIVLTAELFLANRTHG